MAASLRWPVSRAWPQQRAPVAVAAIVDVLMATPPDRPTIPAVPLSSTAGLDAPDAPPRADPPVPAKLPKACPMDPEGLRPACPSRSPLPCFPSKRRPLPRHSTSARGDQRSSDCAIASPRRPSISRQAACPRRIGLRVGSSSTVAGPGKETAAHGAYRAVRLPHAFYRDTPPGVSVRRDRPRWSTPPSRPNGRPVWTHGRSRTAGSGSPRWKTRQVGSRWCSRIGELRKPSRMSLEASGLTAANSPVAPRSRDSPATSSFSRHPAAPGSTSPMSPRAAPSGLATRWLTRRVPGSRDKLACASRSMGTRCGEPMPTPPRASGRSGYRSRPGRGRSPSHRTRSASHSPTGSCCRTRNRSSSHRRRPSSHRACRHRYAPPRSPVPVRPRVPLRAWTKSRPNRSSSNEPGLPLHGPVPVSGPP